MEFLEHLRPALKAAILPPGGILLLLLFGLLIGRRMLGRLLVWMALISLYLLSTSAATHWLAQWLETYPAIDATTLQNQQVQGILVLTAGYVTANPELDDLARPDASSLERLSYAVKLHRETGLPIILSGGKLRAGDEAVAEISARWLHQRTGIEEMSLETRSTTTWENLQYSTPLVHELGLQRIALVTHALHMPRSMLAAQAHGLDPVPAPFGYLGAKPSKPSDYTDASMWQPNSHNMLRNSRLLHELLGIFWYQLRA